MPKKRAPCVLSWDRVPVYTSNNTVPALLYRLWEQVDSWGLTQLRRHLTLLFTVCPTTSLWPRTPGERGLLRAHWQPVHRRQPHCCVAKAWQLSGGKSPTLMVSWVRYRSDSKRRCRIELEAALSPWPSSRVLWPVAWRLRGRGVRVLLYVQPHLSSYWGPRPRNMRFIWAPYSWCADLKWLLSGQKPAGKHQAVRHIFMSTYFSLKLQKSHCFLRHEHS